MAQFPAKVLLTALLLQPAWTQECRMSKYLPLSYGTEILRSPRYPEPYRPGTTCYYYYYTDPGYRLSVDCSEVDMGTDAWECSDRLEFIGSAEADNIGFCSPINVQSYERRLMMTLKSSSSSKGGRFTCSIRAIRTETCDCGWSSLKRIVGGRKAGVNEFPFMVSIRNERLQAHFCGGAIISSRWVVTAAHCLQVLQVAWTSVVVGEHDLSSETDTNATRTYRAAQFISHPQYNSSTTWNDIGLIRTATAIQFSMRVGPVCLPFNRPLIPNEGDSVTAMGWGTTSFGGPTSDVLLKVRLGVVPIANCKAVFNQTASSRMQTCTYAPLKDTCQMDSGGPLIYYDNRTGRMFLAALVSFGGACGTINEPSVNTRMAPYVDWVQQVTNEFYCVK